MRPYQRYMLKLAEISGTDISAVYGPNTESKSVLMQRFALRETSWKEGDQQYTILQYSRPVPDEEHGKTVGHLRSVVHCNGAIVCVAPPRALSMADFSSIHNPFECVAEEVVEGTMVNLFYHAGDWRLATRGTVGARSKFYKGVPTFRTMFLEAAVAVGLDFDLLPKTNCYSFVVQHPLNRIVCPIPVPTLYLVDCYTINPTEMTALRVALDETLMVLLAETEVRFPDSWPISDFAAVTDTYACPTTPFHVPGVMFRVGGAPVRAKVANPNYEAVRALRGNHPKEQYRYLSLRQSGDVESYLRFYPEDKEAFAAFGKHVDAFIKQLHASYVQARPMRGGDESVERHLRPHVRALHRIYIRQLRESGRRVHRGTVADYVANLPPARLMHAINYPIRHAASRPLPSARAAPDSRRPAELVESGSEGGRSLLAGEVPMSN